jgi:hypothetical protein
MKYDITQSAARPLPLLKAKPFRGAAWPPHFVFQVEVNMRSGRLVFLLTFAALFAAAGDASEGVEAVIKMQREGVSQSVLLTFVQTSNMQYDPTADEIQQLEDSKVPATVIVAMLDKGKDAKAVAVSTPPAADEPVTTTTTTETILAPAAEDQNVTFFYESLAPYGEWVSLPNYGWAWRPSIVNLEADWRPYAHGGHWVWTDYGWYWESNYPWAWAAFHYGRWNYDDRNHWVWIPDTTWGPAWVTWRSSDKFYGWAPLPPGSAFEPGVGFSFHNRRVGAELDFGLAEREFTFVPVNAFLEVDIGRHIVPRAQVTTVFNQTTVVKNTYITNNNRIINNGIPEQQVAARTGKRLEQVKVTDATVASGQPIKGEVRSGNTIAAFRPKLANTAPQDPPTVMKKHREAAQIRAQNRANTAPGTAAQNQPPRASGTPAPGAPTASSERDAQRRLIQEKNNRRNASFEKTTPLNPPANKAAEEKRDAARENTPPRQNEAQAQREAQRKAAEEKRDTTPDNVQRKQNEAEAQRKAAEEKRDPARDTNTPPRENKPAAEREAQRNAAAEEKRDATRDQLQQKQKEAQAERDAKLKAADDKREATRENVQQKQEKAEIQREAQRKTAQEQRDTTRDNIPDAQRKAAEEKRDVNRENLQQRKDQIEAQRNAAEAKRDNTRATVQQKQNDTAAERDAQRRLQLEKEKEAAK